MEWYKKYKSTIFKIIILVLILLDLVWSVGNEKNFFYWDKSYNPNSAMFYCVMKAIYTVFLCIIGVIVYKFLNNPVKYVPAIKEWFRYAWPILIVYGILMILLWPGNWGAVGDEFQTFLSVKNLRVWPDQGGASSVFMLLCIMIYPCPAIVSLVQVILSIFIVGNIIRKFCQIYTSGKTGRLLITILFISFPALCYVSCPIRAWMFSLITVAMINNLYIFLKTNDSKILVLMCIEAGICSVIRNEGIAFALLLFAILFFLCKKNKKINWKCFLPLVMVAIFFICNKGIILLGNGSTLNQHSSLFYYTTISMVYADEDRRKMIHDEDWNNIDAVLDLKIIEKYPSMTAFCDGVRGERTFSEPTKEQMKSFNKSARYIISKNISIFIKCKWEAFKWSVGFYPYYRTVGTCWTQENIESWSRNTDLPGDMTTDFKKYADDYLREKISLFLVEPFKFKGVSGFYFIYAFWLPCALICIVTLTDIIRKNYFGVVIKLGECIILIMVMLAAPGRYQMYYLVFYFLGWFEIIRTIIEARNKISYISED